MEDNAKTLQLNDAQKRAVAHKDGPLMVVAGAGTGKTRVIVERIMRLMDEGVDPRSILALTFTEKAAGEMLDRINERRGGYTLDVTIATYNGFGDQLLKDYAVEIGLGQLRLLGDTGQLVFIREHFDEFKLEYFAPVSRPDSQLVLLAGHVSLLKQQLVQPKGYQTFVKRMPSLTEEEKLEKLKHSELAAFYNTYIDLCRANNVIDYDDQLFLTIEMLTQRPNIKKQLQARYQYILVDEFQDTNPMQSAFLDLLAGSTSNLMVVGDDDQSIYGWRGATLANILEFRSRYPDAAQITLIDNYRTTQAILDSAYRLIQNNNPHRLEVMDMLDKRLVSHTGTGTGPLIMHFSNLENELAWVTQQVTDRLKQGQSPNSIAILARRNQIVQKMHEYLELYDVPHAVSGLSNDLYNQMVISQLIETFKAINDPLDDLALFHTLSGPLFALNTSDLSLMAALSRREHTPLKTVIEESDLADAAQALKRIDQWRATSTDRSIGNLAYAIITESGWKDILYEKAEHDVETALEVQALSQFFKILKEFERISDVASLSSFLLNLPTLKAAGSELHDASLEISSTLTNVLSVHRAKGLEWQTVFIIDCTEGSFPMRNHGSSLALPDELVRTSAADDAMAEERRLMYVAATRAKQELILSYSDTHGGGMRKPSRFIAELNGDISLPDVKSDASQQTSMELFAPTTQPGHVELPEAMMRDSLVILSVSQVDCWLRCPQDFFYQYVLQIPIPPEPSRAYGTIMHSTIQTIHETLRSGKEPVLEDLLRTAREALPTQGYLTPATRDRAHQQALQTIRQLYERFTAEPLPSEIEKPFRVEIPETGLILKGRIDAVLPTKKGVEIRDYKTGMSVTTADKAKKRAQASNQLTLYALAWQLMHDDMPDLLTLDFVETNQQGSVRKQEKSLVTITSKLRQMVEQLKASEYPLGVDHTYCKHPLH